MKQHTLKQACSFSGTGLHTGIKVLMTVCPAGPDHGIVFQREDMGGMKIRANIQNVARTRRSTMLKCGLVEVRTTEHLMSAFAGLGIDNALVRIEGAELPILDGSAFPYVEAFMKVGLEEQDAERKYIEIKDTVTFRNIVRGSRIVMEPSSESLFEATIDFKSKVVGVQTASWKEGDDYAREVAPCRTFCFLREVKLLRRAGLIKGGTLSNALVIDEPRGYCNDGPLKFPNECARHKLLDLMGDFALLGAPVKGKITAFKPGHRVNTKAALLLMKKNTKYRWN